MKAWEWISNAWHWAFLRCGPLGPSCEVNWDAWAAMGTMAGVLTALATPWIRDWVLQEKVDGIFALAFQAMLSHSATRLWTMREQFPLGYEDASSGEMEAHVMANVAERVRIGELAYELTIAGKREVDLTRWPSVSPGLAHSVAAAIYAIENFGRCAQAGASWNDDPSKWPDYFLSYRESLTAAQRAVDDAWKQCRRAMEKSGAL